MAKYVQGVSIGEILDEIMDCGIENSAENRLYVEQALEVFLGQRFNVEEFLDELLDLRGWTFAEQERIIAAAELYEGQMVYSMDTPLVAMVQAAKERAAKAVERERSAVKDKDVGVEIG